MFLCKHPHTLTTSILPVPHFPKMFTRPFINAQNCPLFRARAGYDFSGPLARVRTETPQLPDSFSCKPVNMSPPKLKNRFPYKQMNQPTPYKDNLLLLERVNSFAGGTSRQVGKASCQRVHSRTHKPVLEQTCHLVHTATHTGGKNVTHVQV